MKQYYNVKNYARTPEIQELPSLIDIQKASFEDFFYGGKLKELFDEINPIKSFNQNLSLYFPGNDPDSEEFDFTPPPEDHAPYRLLNSTQRPKKGLQIYMQEPKYDEDECIERDMSFAAPLYVQVAMVNHEQGDEIIRQPIFMGEFPLMTEKGTFIINGTERVVVSQLIRSPGVYFDAEDERATGRQLSNAKLIPDRGAWMEFETKKTDYLTIKFNRKRTIPVTILLRALAEVDDGLPKRMSPIKTGDDNEILKLFAEVDNNETHKYIETTIRNEPEWEALQKKYDTKAIGETALIEFFTRMRPGDPQKLPAAREFLVSQLFDQRRYDLERVGRYKLNQRLGLEGVIDLSKRTITKADIVKLVEQMIIINNGGRAKDDIDHLGNRRVKTVGELIGNKLRVGLRRMERVVKERMSIREAEQLTPVSLVNIRPIVAAVREFFGSSQLSQFMEQTNPLSELTHKRTLSALGPGGLRRERAGFDVRDVHHSHYGRICPIETPEGPNIGLIGRLASYARVNPLGFIETPYRRVISAMAVDEPSLIGRKLRDDVEVELLLERGTIIDQATLERLRLFADELGDIPVLAKNDAISAVYARIADLGEDEALETTQREFDAFVESARGDYARLDSDVFEFRLKDAEFDGELARRFLDGYTRRMSDVSQVYDAYGQARAGLKAALASLIEQPESSAEHSRAASRYLEVMAAHDEDSANFLKSLGNLKNAVAEIVVLDEQEIPRELRDRISRWGKALRNYPAVLRKAQAEQQAAAKALDALANPAQGSDAGGLAYGSAGEKSKADALGSMREDFDQFADKAAGEYARLDRAVFEFRLKDAEYDGQLARRFLEVYGQRRDELARILDANAQARAEFSGALGNLARQDGDAAEFEPAASRYLDALERHGDSIAAYQNGLGNLKNAIDAIVKHDGPEIPKNLRDRVSRWGKPVINYPQTLPAMRTENEAAAQVTEIVATLDGGDDARRELYARIAELAGDPALQSTRQDFDAFVQSASKDYARLDEHVFTLRLKDADLDAERAGEFLALHERRLQEVAEAYDGYSGARAELREALLQLKGEDDIPDEHKTAASVFLEAQANLDKGRETFEQALGNLSEAVSTILKPEIPKNLRDRVTRWGRDVINYPQVLAAFQAEQDAARQSIEALLSDKAASGDIIRERPVTDDLLGEQLGRGVSAEIYILDEGEVIDADLIATAKRYGVMELPVVPFATHEIEYLSADNEDKFIIAQANAVLDDLEQFVSNRVSARFEQGFLSVPPQRIQYMDIAPRQIVGISAALIPFLSHDAANRALMGSNMQRQAVPLLTPDVSVVSTGMERQAASDSGQVLVSDIEAEVISVQGHRVIVRKADGEELTFQLRKYERSNQSTCIDQRPVVRKGDWIKPGDVIADSSSTYDGHLALGHDVLTCFLSWDGGNYEDALLVSEDMLRNDKFTSIHIEKHEIEARDTKLGAEEITYDIPNVGEEALKDLDEHGIVRIGAEVGPNDILVGKITPKGEKELSPEEKLLRAIFGEQAREVKDSSLRLPHGDRGKVIDVKVFTRDEHPDLPAGVEKMVRVSVAQRRKLTVGDKMAGRHGNKGVISKIVSVEDMPYIDGGVPVEVILNPLGVPSRMNIGQILELHLGWAADRMGFRAITPVFDGVKEHEIQAELGRAWMIDWAWRKTTARAWENQARLAASVGMAEDEFQNDLDVIRAFLAESVGADLQMDIQEKVTELADEREDIIDKMVENHLRRVAVTEVLSEHGYDPQEIMVYNNDNLSAEARQSRDLQALEVSLRLWIEQTSPVAVALDDEMSIRELFAIGERVMFATGTPLPHYGKQTLYDGRTGEPFDRSVAVGYVHMLKLAHLVEDKAHARSTGPYSLVTQQPLGGKAQFGGQRFGEMEVWALEAYGAAHILQEMLTVKSDDVQGRVKTYESIVKGEPIEEPGIPTSFRVLVKELQSLGLSVEAITGAGDVIRFGKYDEQTRRPQPETGLLGLGAR